MIDNREEIPVIWKKPHASFNVFHVEALKRLLDQFIKRYRNRLQIRDIMIDLEMPKNSAGYSNSIFEVKLHLRLKSGKILRAESKKRSISDVMKNITKEIDHQFSLTDRQKIINRGRSNR